MAFSPAEWRARQQLAACCRVLHLLGWAELMAHQVSLRVPGPTPAFLTHPYGLHANEVNASNLVKLDLDGNVIGRSEWGVDPAGLVLHAGLHAGIAQAHCVMQVRTTTGTAVASAQQGLTLTNVHAAQLAGRMAYHDFEGTGLRADEGLRLAQTVAGRHAVVLRNQGLLAWDETLPKAFHTLWTLQRACDVQVAAAALGPVVPLSDAALRRSVDEAHKAAAKADQGADLFDALVRQVDERDRSWRD